MSKQFFIEEMYIFSVQLIQKQTSTSGGGGWGESIRIKIAKKKQFRCLYILEAVQLL